MPRPQAKPTTATRRIQRQVGRGKPLGGDSPPSERLFLHASRPCGTCTLPGNCPVPAHITQVPLPCMKYLMSQGRTWACPYNINSWCCYLTSDYACYAQDLAEEASNHRVVMEYRDLEVAMYKALDHSSHRSSTRFVTLAGLLVAKRKKILDQVQAQNLTACAFFECYSSSSRKAVINRPDTNITRLLVRGELRLRGAFSV